jgi:hypothetical protein
MSIVSPLCTKLTCLALQGFVAGHEDGDYEGSGDSFTPSYEEPLEDDEMDEGIAQGPTGPVSSVPQNADTGGNFPPPEPSRSDTHLGVEEMDIDDPRNVSDAAATATARSTRSEAPQTDVAAEPAVEPAAPKRKRVTKRGR